MRFSTLRDALDMLLRWPDGVLVEMARWLGEIAKSNGHNPHPGNGLDPHPPRAAPRPAGASRSAKSKRASIRRLAEKSRVKAEPSRKSS